MKLLTFFLLLTLNACGPTAKDSELKYNSMSFNYMKSGNLSFSSSEKKLIKNAMNILAGRVDQNNVWNCANRNWRVWEVRGSGQNITTTDRFKSFKSLHQKAFRTGKIPKINIYPFNENSQAHGRAYVGGHVKAKFVSTTSLVPIYKFSGTFNIKLNRKHLSSSKWQKPEVWAGTIFHEMLHQMGYAHKKGIYDDDMFITVLGDCIQTNGKYTSRKKLGLTGGSFFPTPD